MVFRQAVAASILATLTAGCGSLGGAWVENTKRQVRRAVEEIQADVSVLDSENDGLDAFGSADAKHLRAARAELGP